MALVMRGGQLTSFFLGIRPGPSSRILWSGKKVALWYPSEISGNIVFLASPDAQEVIVVSH